MANSESSWRANLVVTLNGTPTDLGPLDEFEWPELEADSEEYQGARGNLLLSANAKRGNAKGVVHSTWMRPHIKALDAAVGSGAVQLSVWEVGDDKLPVTGSPRVSFVGVLTGFKGPNTNASSNDATKCEFTFAIARDLA